MKHHRSLDCKAACVATVFLLLGTFAPSAAAPPPKPLREGVRIYVEQIRAPFPDIRMVDAEGKQHTLSESRGTLRLINFWATWCPPCVEEMPSLQALQQRYTKQLHIITLNEDRKAFDVITPFVQKHLLTSLTHYWDKNNLEYRKLQMQGLPMSFLVDAQGNLIATFEGKTEWLGVDVRGFIEHTIHNIR
jgi:thiol-disulfide isomerase/thioredoxin